MSDTESHMAKHGPTGAGTSTGRSDGSAAEPPRRRRGDKPFVLSDVGADALLKQRFQTAYQIWRIRSSGTREIFADALGVNFTAVKRHLSDSDSTRVSPELVVLAEGLAAKADRRKNDAQLGALLRQMLFLEVELESERAWIRRRLYRDGEEQAA